MTPITFIVRGIPKPAGSKRGFAIKKGGAYTGRVAIMDACKGSKDWKQDVKQAALAVAPEVRLMGPLAVEFAFTVSRPKGHYGSGKNSAVLKPTAPRYPTVKPDVLKLARGVEDALTGIIWGDDAQIVSEHLTKNYGPFPGVEITICTAS